MDHLVDKNKQYQDRRIQIWLGGREVGLLALKELKGAVE
jgi:hypothetical protein